MKYNFVLFFLLLLSSCFSRKGDVASGSKVINHQLFTDYLQNCVEKSGLVNYKQAVEDSLILFKYIDLLSSHHPDTSWTHNEKKAYWINAYNAFTLKLIINNYPVHSIKDVVSGFSIPFVHSPWDMEFINIGGYHYDLNNIEHNILRKMGDPRIHFAINCASVSCPDLYNKAYEAESLDSLLEVKAIQFIQDTSKNKLTKESIAISRIFQWFKSDFTNNANLPEFLNQYSKIDVSEADISYLDYNWDLNETKVIE